MKSSAVTNSRARGSVPGSVGKFDSRQRQENNLWFLQGMLFGIKFAATYCGRIIGFFGFSVASKVQTGCMVT